MKLHLNYTLGRDANGNRIVHITPANAVARGFSIQTNGNLPITYRNGICNATAQEVAEHVRRYGTARQNEMIKEAQQ